MIPVEAVEAAAKALYHDGWDGPPYWESLADDHSDKVRGLWAAQKALEAAAPILLSHEREMTRLAHLDAMVNRETKADELRAEYRRGYRDGLIDRKEVTAERGGE